MNYITHTKELRRNCSSDIFITLFRNTHLFWRTSSVSLLRTRQTDSKSDTRQAGKVRWPLEKPSVPYKIHQHNEALDNQRNATPSTNRQPITGSQPIWSPSQVLFIATIHIVHRIQLTELHKSYETLTNTSFSEVIGRENLSFCCLQHTPPPCQFFGSYEATGRMLRSWHNEDQVMYAPRRDAR